MSSPHAIAVAVVLAWATLTTPGGGHAAQAASPAMQPATHASQAAPRSAAPALAAAVPAQPPATAPAAGLGVVDRWFARIGIFGGVVAAIFAAINAFWTRRSNSFANSVGMYRRYLELCVQYPAFAEPFPINRYTDSDEEIYRQYQWFVGVLFRACEEVLDHGHDKDRWKKTVLDQLRHHREFIDNNPWLNTGGIELYCSSLRALIAQVRQEPRPSEHPAATA